MRQFDATVEFYKAIDEIQLLMRYSRRNQRSTNKYALFNKAAIVLLCGKFESFIESFLKDYAYEFKRMCSNKSLIQPIQDHIVDNLLDAIYKYQRDVSKRRPYVEALARLCGDAEVAELDSYPIKAQFKVGRHGEKELKRLLTSFGFEKFLCKQSVVDALKKMNSLYAIRNNILHEDATPGLTHSDVDDYLSHVCQFVAELQTDASMCLRVYGLTEVETA